MTEAVFQAMGDVLTRWTMGSAAAPAASMWKSALGAEPDEAELRLLALSGHFLGAAVTAEPPPGLHTLADIPDLVVPTVPEAVRPLVRRVLNANKERGTKAAVLQFLAARGWTVHPGDWMPAANDEDAPDVYAPWRAWAENAASTDGKSRAAVDGITAETWDDYLPVARKLALAELRQRDPVAGRTLLEAKLADENAEARLKLLALLEIGLSEFDIPFLERVVSADRAPTMKTLATSLLHRLRRGVLSSEEIAELKSFFPVQTKGLLRRSRVIQVETIKTQAQRQRRAELLRVADIDSFAGSLGLQGSDLIAGWPWGVDTGADSHLILMIGRTGTGSLVMQTAELVCREGGDGMGYVSGLLARLTGRERSALAEVALNRPDCRFDQAWGIGGAASRLNDPLDTHAGASLLGSFAGDGIAYLRTLELWALGMITARAWARRVIERLNAAGLLQGDPRLDMLKLNDALDDNGVNS